MKNKLTITEILDAFPDECRKIIPKVNQLIRGDLRKYKKRVDYIRNKHYDKMTEIFLIYLIEADLNVKEKQQLLSYNESLLRILNAPEDQKINDLMIEQAKFVPILRIHDFRKTRRGSGKTNTECPFHPEKHPSFFVYDNNTYYCFSCHRSGDSIQFVREIHGFSFIDAVKFLLKH